MSLTGLSEPGGQLDQFEESGTLLLQALTGQRYINYISNQPPPSTAMNRTALITLKASIYSRLGVSEYRNPSRKIKRFYPFLDLRQPQSWASISTWLDARDQLLSMGVNIGFTPSNVEVRQGFDQAWEKMATEGKISYARGQEQCAQGQKAWNVAATEYINTMVDGFLAQDWYQARTATMDPMDIFKGFDMFLMTQEGVNNIIPFSRR